MSSSMPCGRNNMIIQELIDPNFLHDQADKSTPIDFLSKEKEQRLSARHLIVKQGPAGHGSWWKPR